MPTADRAPAGTDEGQLSFPALGAHVSVPTRRRGTHTAPGPSDPAELVAALALLLARHTDADTVTVGLVRREDGRWVLRPVRLDLSEPSWARALAAVRDQAAAAPSAAADRPLPAAVPPVVVVEGAPGAGETPEVRRAVRAAQVAVRTEPGGGDARWEHDADRHSTTDIARLAAQLRRVAAAGRAEPDLPVGAMDLLEEPERAEVLAASGPRTPSDGRDRLDLMFARQAARHPEHIAVTTAEGDLTYGRLDAWSRAVADALTRRGVGPGDRVAVRLPRSAALVAALLGVLRTGAAYVPLDPAQPAGRQRRITDAAQPAALLVPEGDDAPGPGTPVVSVPPLAAAPPAAGGTAGTGPLPAPDRAGGQDGPDAPAYVLFTSGSTGQPKGVEVRHTNVVRLFDTTRTLFAFGDRDVWLNAHNFGFDASVWEVYGALLHGGRLVIPDTATLRDPDALTGLVAREGVTMLALSPTAFEGFRDSAVAAGLRMPALRHLVLCAEALALGSLARWYEHLGDTPTRVCNMYGITETTVHSTHLPLTPADVRDPRRRIGRPLPDTALHVLDAQGRPVPFGVPGEICVGGPGVSGGYLRPPEDGRDPFLPDPFSARPGARMYRSGDKGRRLADGSVEYLGRFDHQVKIRGHRVELGEVEAAFLTLPGIRSARAWTVRRPGRPAVIAVAVVPAGDARPDTAQLRARAAERLPAYMVPAAVVAVPALPRTPNGKLDVAVLPDPFAEPSADSSAEPSGGPSGGPSAEPSADPSGGPEAADPALRAVRDAFREVLGLTGDVDAGFFALGGDSITALRLVALLRSAGHDASVADVYAHRTTRDLAAALSPRDRASDEDLRPFALLAGTDTARVPADAVDAMPATRLQQGMLLHSLLDGEHIYHDVLGYTVAGAPDEDTLRAALDAAVRRHPVLRTSFSTEGTDAPLQIVHPTARIPLHVRDLRALPEPERQDRMARWVQEERRTPFDWTVPGLLRVFAHRTDDDAWVLSLSVHHCILDGWSAATLVTELLAPDTAAPDRPEDADAPGHMARYGRLERAAESDAASLAYWRDYLRDAEPTSLPGDEAAAPGTAAPRTAPGGEPAADHAADHDVDTVTVAIPAEAVRALRELARAEGVPAKTAYLAAHTALLAHTCGRPEVLTGVVTSCRVEEEGGDRALGLFLNTLPLRVRGGDQTWRELLREVWLNESRSHPHRRVPFERVQAASAAARLAPTAFNYTDFHVYHRLAAAGVRLEATDYREATDFRLLLTVAEEPVGDRVTVTLAYDRAALGAEQAAAWGQRYADLVHLAGRDPDLPAVRALAERVAAEGAACELPATPPAAPYRPLTARVAERLLREPSAVAQSARGREQTCARLAVAVQHLRDDLAAAGVRPGQRVACFLQRGLDPLTALLGVWAAGAVYTPVDPALPEARQREMTARAGCVHAVRSQGVRAERVAWDGPQTVLGPAPAGGRADPAGWHAARPGEEAYVLFTSGSTGVPKAVAMPHRSIAALVAWQLDQPEFRTPSRIGQYAALSFDVSVQEMLTAAAGGGTLVVVPDEARRDAQALLEVLGREWVEVLFLPPAMLAQLGVGHRAFGTVPTALRAVLTAGEALVVTEEVRDLCRAGRIALVNQYGPTETHVAVAHRLTGDPADWPERPPIGRPVAGVAVSVRDPLGRPVPRGTPGELVIGGTAPALGYVDAAGTDPRTAERFTTSADGAPAYRTGDLVRWDGTVLDHLGRLDDQLQIRGFRIEPGEVAPRLLEHPAVTACAVIGEPGPGGALVLAAYLVADPALPAPTAADLTAHLRARLADHAVPARFTLLTRLPLTANGKLDRAALAADPSLRARAAEEPPDAALSATERRLLSAWQEVLGHPVASATVSFFDAGGTSLLLLPLYLTLRKSFADADLTLNDLFRFPTVRQFARYVDGDGRRQPAAAPRPGRVPAHMLAAARRSRSARGQEKTDE
ncbi:putative non-ribosomal peptide synthetase [Actinacidiphila reveromycinica]|uniref:Putative non-ribosomal peptide synthetase n=1 Tax=Actinacidiphila reveromycinica TaxID=659352 RepID=A0A7U3VSP8_9ACTN|nr:non-ribosomal peptide synthetase [Streptomyces sp. SN-593]BBB01930.1 putative non-ribosomal peptide synthetase [Streptomyces sp. SN-593]